MNQNYFFQNFLAVVVVILNLLLLYSCPKTNLNNNNNHNHNSSSTTEIMFLKVDNPSLDKDIIFPFDITKTTKFVIYIDKPATEMSSLSLKMRIKPTSDESYNFTPNPIGVLMDYSTPQTFTMRRTTAYVGITANIRISVFRKPTVSPSNNVTKDIVTLDFNVQGDTLEEAVFAMYPSSITINNPNNVLQTPMKIKRNLASGFSKYILMDRAGSVLGGTSTDAENMLQPSTSYKLYLAYPFANGSKVIDLGAYTTSALSTLGTDNTIYYDTIPVVNTGLPISITEELFKVAVIIYDFNNTSTRTWSGDILTSSSENLITNGSVTTHGMGLRERIINIPSTRYTMVIVDNKNMTSTQLSSMENNLIPAEINLQYNTYSKGSGYLFLDR